MAYLSPLGGQITEVDTAAHNFPVATPGTLILQTPAANLGTVTITDAQGATGGLVLAAGVGVSIPFLVLGPFLDMSSLTYKFSHASDVLNYFVLR